MLDNSSKMREARLAAEAFEASKGAAMEEHRERLRSQRRKLELMFEQGPGSLGRPPPPPPAREPSPRVKPPSARLLRHTRHQSVGRADREEPPRDVQLYKTLHLDQLQLRREIRIGPRPSAVFVSQPREASHVSHATKPGTPASLGPGAYHPHRCCGRTAFPSSVAGLAPGAAARLTHLQPQRGRKG